MQSFGWKRKRNVTNSKLSAFNDEDEEEIDPFIDWLTAAKRPKALLLEDNSSKAKRLRSEGVTLAEVERWWEAIGLWKESLSLNPKDYEVQDMLSQAYLKVGEIYPAIQSASKVIKVAPLWWPGYQTLGRTQLGIGEVTMAIKSFSKAIHLAPDKLELWKEDLEWSVELRRKQKNLELMGEGLREDTDDLNQALSSTSREESMTHREMNSQENVVLSQDTEEAMVPFRK